MNKSNLMQAAILAAAVIGLTGCDSVRETLGLTRHVPDETQVTARPALTLPPDYDLRPPGTGTDVSGQHETGMSAPKNADGTPVAGGQPKEEKGFFGRFFDMFEDTPEQPAAPAGAAAAPAAAPSPEPTMSQQVNGIPSAPAQAVPPAAPAPMPEASKPEEKGFFGRLFDVF